MSLCERKKEKKKMELGIRRNNVPSFAEGLHVLVVDHDKHSLKSIASMLQNCSFKGILMI